MRKVAAGMMFAIIMSVPANADYVTAPEGLRVRAEPNTNSEVVRILSFAEEVDGPIRNGWMKLSDGYAKASFLSEENPLDEYTDMGSWLCTAYTHTGYPCYDGSYPEAGYSVACNSLPIGTEIYIAGIGRRTVTDRGPSSMPEGWVDIFMDGYTECVNFGAQYREVYVKGGGK
jgi:3D (Asp-Asp-Asp) domain-containing protein